MTRLETARLVLREWTLADVDSVLDIYGDPEVMRHIGDGAPLDRNGIESGIRKTIRRYRHHGMGYLCLERKADGRILGHAGLQRWDGTTDIEIGWLLGREFQGLGYATEAARAALDHGFGSLGLRRIVAVAKEENVASIAIMTRLRMEDLGPAAYKGQRVVRYVLTREDYLSST